MQLNSIADIERLVQSNNFTIFELPKSVDFANIMPNAYRVAPNEKGNIKREEIDEVIKLSQNCEAKDFYFVVENPESMNSTAMNVFLKSLEEPNTHIHYVFLTRNIVKLLPTVKSRAECYYLPNDEKISDAPNFSADTIALAKSYITARPGDLPAVVDKIMGKKKDEARDRAIEVVDAAISLMYKSYFKDGNSRWLQKLEQLLQIQIALKANGNVKLQLIAGML